MAVLAWWLNQDRAEYCRVCSGMHRQRPPCGRCEWRAPKLKAGNEEIWELWLALQTQWRAGAAGLIGLDYPAVPVAARALGVEWRAPRVWRGLQQLEAEALDHWAKAAQDGRKHQ